MHMCKCNSGTEPDSEWLKNTSHALFFFHLICRTVLGWSPNRAQNQMYLEYVQVWIAFLQQSGTDADIVVLMLCNDAGAKSILKASGAIIKHIDPIEQAQDIEHFEPWFVDIVFAKLRAFELTEYERVQLMDSDVAIEDGKSLDPLFTFAKNSKLVSEGLGSESPLRAGWMLLKPSKDDFAYLESLVKNAPFDESLGWDYLDLPVDYPGWARTDELSLSKWGFYGSQLEQGKTFQLFRVLQSGQQFVM